LAALAPGIFTPFIAVVALVETVTGEAFGAALIFIIFSSLIVCSPSLTVSDTEKLPAWE